MTPNRLVAIAARLSISAVFTLWVFAPNAQAQSAATAINGVYNGTYTCAIGPRTLKLSLLASGNGSLTGVFTFYLPPTSRTQAFSYSLNGTIDAASGKFKLDPVKWEVPPPGGYMMVGMDGAFDPSTGQVAGKITYGNCRNFQATRDQAASANIATVIAPPKAAGAAQPVPRSAAPARQSSAALAAPTSKALAAASPPPPRTESGAGDTDLETSSPSVALSVCNAGKVAIDVFLANRGKVSSSHVLSGDCVYPYEGRSGAAYVGFAFVDSKGQWGAPRRLDLLPDVGEDVLDLVEQNVSVPHGNTSVSLPMKLLFRPRAPTCTTSSSTSARLSLPLNATSAQRARAAMADANAPPDETICEHLVYNLNALAYPDSREVTFNKFCDPCEKKAEARITPEERATSQQRSKAINQEIGNLRATGPLGDLVMGNLVKQANQQAQEEERERERERRRQQPESYKRMSWDELHLALKNIRPSGGRPPEMPQFLIIRGTVSRVDVSPPQASEHWVDVYFRESAEQASNSYETFYGAFNVCTLGPEIFQDMFGPDFRSRMIGQVLEVQGEFQRNYCKGWKASIRITLAQQVHRISAGN